MIKNSLRVTDPLVGLNRQVSSVLIKQSGHFKYVYHMIIMYIWNQPGMMNKMAARDLFYNQGLLSYGDSKHAKKNRSSSLNKLFQMQ